MLTKLERHVRISTSMPDIRTDKFQCISSRRPTPKTHARAQIPTLWPSPNSAPRSMYCALTTQVSTSQRRRLSRRYTGSSEWPLQKGCPGAGQPLHHANRIYSIPRVLTWPGKFLPPPGRPSPLTPSDTSIPLQCQKPQPSNGWNGRRHLSQSHHRHLI